MDLCHLKNSELEPQYRKYKGRVVLPGDIVKDDSGSYAVFTEQGSSASQTTAAKVMDIISSLPGCSGQAADCSIRLYSGQNGRCIHVIYNSKVRMSRYLILRQTHKWPHIMVPEKEGPVVPLERNLYGHLLAGLLWKRQFEDSFYGNMFGTQF